MHAPDFITAIALGIVEGLTEFIPVSSTGHLLLAERFLCFDDPEFAKTFSVLIQLGAVLAVLAVCFQKLWRLVRAIPSDAVARRFALGVVVAVLPAMAVGAFAYEFIKRVLFDPWVVCTSLVLGGAVLLWVDRRKTQPVLDDATRFPLKKCLGIGLAQCVSMIPGVSRSGATIVSAILFGADKRAAAEFSFFIAIPTMAAAFAWDLLKSYDRLNLDGAAIIAVGFVTSFAAGFVVVRALLDFVSRRGLGIFGWWRIAVGLAGFALLAAFSG